MVTDADADLVGVALLVADNGSSGIGSHGGGSIVACGVDGADGGVAAGDAIDGPNHGGRTSHDISSERCDLTGADER